MFSRRKEPKRKSIALTLMRDVQGSAAEKLRMFEKVRAAGGFANEHPPIWRREDAARFRSDGEGEWLRAAGRFPLANAEFAMRGAPLCPFGTAPST